MRFALIAAAFASLGLSPAAAEAPGNAEQTVAINEALDWFCADWVRKGASDAPKSRADKPGWIEMKSAAPAVGPILVKGGSWGRANLVRVAQAAGHRCSISMQLSRADWTTDTAHAAVTAWTVRSWPKAARIKDRGAGPRDTRETVWAIDGALSLTLQESPASGAQPNVFITLARADGRAI